MTFFFRLESKVVEINTKIAALEKELQQVVVSEDFEAADNLNRGIDEAKSTLAIYKNDISMLRLSIFNLRNQRYNNLEDLVS